ncbi:protein HIRA-like isoform X2 [Gigantopelta aegis]|nr:protein HIRA-like isoform X2 [Gigantopelta aegis]
MSPVRDEKDERDENIPKVLCQMDNHLACVNCVRWSHNGSSLATGSDDKLIIIWQTSRHACATAVFGSRNVNVEQWRPVHTLRGHTGDVLDLAWAPCDMWLASCSVDNTVVVWNTNKFHEQVAVLKGHSGLVKGVTWDPVGKYIASQSDDKSLRIWRTRDWQMEASIHEPFKECAGTTHVLRLNWSPDGHYIVSAHAMNNSGPTAQIIERQGWKATLDFVGHRKAITVVRFNPNILTKKIKKDSSKNQQYSCCAIGSKDRSLSIWLTALKRPLVVTHDLFESPILDIAWSKNGLELMCCSLDGSVAFLDFTKEEIGVALSVEERHSLLERIYGKSLPIHKSANHTTQIIESAAILNLQQQQAKKMDVIAPKELSLTSNSCSSLTNGEKPFKPRDKQIETKTPDGRRRITPIFLAPQPDVGGAPLPFNPRKIEFSTTKEQSSIVIEKQNRVTGPGLSPVTTSPSVTSPNHNRNSQSATDIHMTPTKTSTGSPAKQTSQPVKSYNDIQPMTALEKTPEKQKAKPLVEDPPVEKDKPEKTTSVQPIDTTPMNSTPVAPPAVEKEKASEKARLTTSLPIKRKLEERRQGRGRPRKIDKEAREAERSFSVGQMTPVVVDREIARHIPINSELLLPVPSIEKTSEKLIHGKMGSANSLVLEVENNIQAGSLTIHRVKCSKGGDVVWEQVFSSKINIINGSSFLTCVACENNTLSIFSEGGRKVLPSLMLNSKISVLECKNHYVMAITQKGSLYVWNMHTVHAVITNECLSCIMSANDKLEKATLTSEGIPVVSLSNKKSFTFSSDIGSWLLINDKTDCLQTCSAHQSCLPDNLTDKLSGPLSSLQSKDDRPGYQASRVSGSSPSLQKTSTVSHLETQVAVCLGLKSSSEYQFWLLTYVRYLVQEGFESKLREVCDDLLGPLYRSKKSISWQDNILGINKRDLLKQILPIIGANLRWQRLYTEYQEQLDSIS